MDHIQRNIESTLYSPVGEELSLTSLSNGLHPRPLRIVNPPGHSRRIRHLSQRNILHYDHLRKVRFILLDIGNPSELLQKLSFKPPVSSYFSSCSSRVLRLSPEQFDLRSNLRPLHLDHLCPSSSSRSILVLNMCLYHIRRCPNQHLLPGYLFSARYEGEMHITRCYGWNGSIYLEADRFKLCPHMVIRHGELSYAEKALIYGRGLGKSAIKRGCQKCWKNVRAQHWLKPMVAGYALANSSDEEVRSFDNTDSEYEGSAEENRNETTANDSSDDNLTTTDDEETPPNTKPETIYICDSGSDTNVNFEDEIQTHPNEIADSRNRYRCSSRLFSASPQDDTTIKDTPPLAKPHLKENHPKNALQRRREQIQMAMANEMSQGKENPQKRLGSPQSLSKVPTSTTNEPKVKFVRAPDGITRFSERRADSQPLPQPEEWVEKAFDALGESLPDSKALNETDATINEDDELEIVSAVRDGSYKDALSKLFEENMLDVSSDQISFRPKKDEKVAISGPKLRKRPRLIEDATYVEAEMLRENVKRLRCEKATLSNRIASLLQEQSTAAIREAALMQRVADLESKLDTS